MLGESINPQLRRRLSDLLQRVSSSLPVESDTEEIPRANGVARGAFQAEFLRRWLANGHAKDAAIAEAVAKSLEKSIEMTPILLQRPVVYQMRNTFHPRPICPPGETPLLPKRKRKKKTPDDDESSGVE